MLRSRRKAEEALKNMERIRERFKAVTAVSGISLSELKELEEERIAVEIELQEAYEYSENILQTVNDGLIILDGDLTVITANSSFYRIFGVTEEETVNRKIYNIDHNQWDIPQFRKLLEDIVPYNTEFSNYAVEYNFQLIGIRTMRLNARRIDFGLSKTRMILLAVEDVTLQQQSQKTINLQVEQKAATDKELEKLAYSMSHDLYNPIRGISGYNGLLMEMCKERECDPKEREYLQKSSDNIAKMEFMLDSMHYLLALLGEILNRDYINLSAVAKQMTDGFQREEATRHGDIVIHSEVIAYVSKKYVKDLLYGLLSNAWKYTGAKDRYYIEFGKKEMDGKTIYFVKDNGIGFKQEYADKIFQPFYRLQGHSSVKEGYGVGLTIVNAIITKHQGNIWAESEPDKGATFYFTLG